LNFKCEKMAEILFKRSSSELIRHALDDVFDYRLMVRMAMESDHVKVEIRDWLLKSGMSIREMPDQHAAFNFDVTDEEGRHVTIALPLESPDRITLASRIALSPSDAARIEAMPNGQRSNLLWDLRFGLLNIGVGFMGVQLPLPADGIFLGTDVWLDALTKHELMNRLLLLRRALLLINWTINRAFQEPPRETGAVYGFRSRGDQ
jgi:hypothetical protein